MGEHAWYEELISILGETLEDILVGGFDKKEDLGEALNIIRTTLTEEEERAAYSSIKDRLHDYFIGEQGFLPEARESLEKKGNEDFFIGGLELDRRYEDLQMIIQVAGVEVDLDKESIYQVHFQSLVELFEHLASHDEGNLDSARQRVLSYGVASLIENYEEHFGFDFLNTKYMIKFRRMKKKLWSNSVVLRRKLIPSDVDLSCSTDSFIQYFEETSRLDMIRFHLTGRVKEYIIGASYGLALNINEKHKERSMG